MPRELPRHHRAEIDSDGFVVSVARITQPAQQIAQTEQGDQRMRVGRGSGVVVGVDHSRELGRKLPWLRKDRSTLAVSESEAFALTLVQPDPASRRRLERADTVRSK